MSILNGKVNRCLSYAEIINISDIENPVYEGCLPLDGHPSAAEVINGEICISCGHGGIYVISKK